jgi:hypothetical protein
MIRILAVAGVLLSAVACEDTTPCDDYATYMCDCHANDDGFDCQALRNALTGADQSQQDQCVIDLEDQQDADGGVCGGTDTDVSG